MTRSPTRNTIGLGTVCLLLAVGLLAGCGAAPPPSREVPDLTASLDRVDSDIVQGRYDETRAQIKALVATTRFARNDGRITAAQASAILTAATVLLDALPTSPTPSATPSPNPSTPPSQNSTTDATPPQHPGRGKGHDHGNGNGNGHGDN